MLLQAFVFTYLNMGKTLNLPAYGLDQRTQLLMSLFQFSEIDSVRNFHLRCAA